MGVTSISAFAKASVEAGIAFDSSMSQVAATMGTTVDQIQELRDTALEMGSTTAFSATEAAQGLNILAMSGLEAEDQIAGISTVLDLAAAGTLSLESAASYTVGAVKGFSDSMDNAQYYADLMAKGATLANTSVDGLGAAMSQSAATASSYGQTAEGVTLALLRLAEQNVSGEAAATALNRAMSDLYAPTDAAKNVLAELGVSAYDGYGNFRDLNDVMDDLSAALSGYSAEQATAYASQGVVQGWSHAQMAISVLTANLNGATLAQAALNGQMTIGQTVVALLTGEITLAELATALWTKVQIGLNVAMAANPIGIWVAAIAAAVAAVTALVLWLKKLVTSTKEVEEETEELNSSLEESTEVMDEATAAAQSLTSAEDSLRDSTITLADANNTLSDALKEQEESGSLSLNTALDFIDAGYAAAIAIDTETGAVTLNKERYIELTNAKIEDQIASLEAQKQSQITAAKVEAEAIAAQHAGSAYWEMAASKLYAEKADTQAIDVQIAAMQRLRENIGTVSSAAATASKSVSSASRSASSLSKQVETQAEKDLAEYKTLKDTLDHEKAMDLIEEAEYYREMGELRDRYLTDDSNLSEYRKVSEDIYKYNKQLLENANEQEEKLFKEREKALEEYQKRVEEVYEENAKLEQEYQDTLVKRASEIFNSFGLFDEIPERQKKSGTELMENLRGQIDSIQGFYNSITELEERGVSAALVEEIRSMGVGAADELAALLSLSDEQLSEYSDLYGEKQALANEIALAELENLREETDAKIEENMNSIESIIQEAGPEIGYALAEGLAEGIRSGIGLVKDAAEELADAASGATRAAAGVNSPSTVFAEIGKYMVQGLGVGWERELPGVRNQIEKSMNFGTATVDFPSSGLGMSSAAIVNSVSNGGMGANGPVSLTVQAVLPDGTVLKPQALREHQLLPLVTHKGGPMTQLILDTGGETSVGRFCGPASGGKAP